MTERDFTDRAAPPSALLFDLDGTLVHSDPLHHQAFREVFSEFGIDLSWDAYRERIGGRVNADIMQDFLPDLDRARQEALSDRKEALFRESLDAEVAPMAGAVALIDWAEARGIPVAVATNAPRANAEVMLAASGLAPRFAVVIAAEDREKGKPDPEPYLRAADGLGVSAAEALAFEDSGAGIQAARAAGAYVFGITSSLDAAAVLQAGAHEAIEDFTDAALWARLQPEGTRAP